MQTSAKQETQDSTRASKQNSIAWCSAGNTIDDKVIYSNSKRLGCWAPKMTQLVKSLFHKYEDLSLDPQHAHKSGV